MDKCPICNKELPVNESFCPNCGFEIHLLPEGVSNDVRQYEKEREERALEAWTRRVDEVKNHNRIVKELEDARSNIKGLQKIVEDKDKEAARLKVETERLMKIISDNEKLLKDKDSELEKLRELYKVSSGHPYMFVEIDNRVYIAIADKNGKPKNDLRIAEIDGELIMGRTNSHGFYGKGVSIIINPQTGKFHPMMVTWEETNGIPTKRSQDLIKYLINLIQNKK